MSGGVSTPAAPGSKSMAVPAAASIHLIASRRSRRGRASGLISKIAVAHLFQDAIARAPGEGHDGEGGILVRVGAKGPAVGDEKILHVPGLVPPIRHRGL